MSFGQLIASMPTQGTQSNTYTTAISMLTSGTGLGSPAFITLTPSQLLTGSRLRIEFEASVSNRVTGPDTFTIQVMVGAVIAFTSGAITLTTTAHTNIPVSGVINLTCQAMGNGTKTQMMGRLTMTGQMIQQGGTAGADSATLSNTIIMPNTAAALGTGFDGTVANTLDFFVAQSVSNAGNGFRLDQYNVYYWGPGGW